ncbi:MAG: hypothetical protein IJY44_04105 [Bacteroidaceae bacterium]|nr:hypothetical protein [Bacteroidaceae bacterium]
MRKQIFLILSLLLLLSGCNEEGLPNIPAFKKNKTADRTLLVYMMAENSLSGMYQDYAQSDLNEIKQGLAAIGDNSRLFVYLDNNDAAVLPAIYQYHYYNDMLYENKVYSFEEDLCSSDTAVLGDVLDFILDKYPTKELDIIMWSHADGWLRGPERTSPHRSVGIDNGKNNYTNNVVTTIEMEELAALLKGLPLKVDRLMFDACLMQCVEVAYALRDAAEWVIASPAEIPGQGAPYDRIVPAFLSGYDGVEGIMDEYSGYYDSSVSGGVVLSAVRTAHMQELADVTAEYVKKYLAKGNSNVYDGMFAYVPGGAYDSMPSYPAYYDLNSVMKSCLAADEYARWRTALDKAVPYLNVSATKCWYSMLVTNRNHFIDVDMEECCGMSMYVPQEAAFCDKFNEDFKTAEWYRAAGWDVAGW